MKKKHSHKKHHRMYRKIKYWFKHHHRFAAVSIAVFVMIVAGILFLAKMIVSTQNDQHITSGEARDVDRSYREISFRGKTYRYNSRLTTFLVACIDSEGETGSYGQHSGAPEADSIYLAAANEKTGQLTLISIDPDTVTDVRRSTGSGDDTEICTAKIWSAYSCGDGGKSSCDYLCEAVSGLFGEIPINEYVILNRSFVSYLNQLADGTGAAASNDDPSDLHPEWEKIFRLAETDPQGLWEKIKGIQDFISTSITENKYISTVRLFSGINIDETVVTELEGEDRKGTENDGFYVDEEKLQNVLLDTFYEETQDL